MVFYKTDDEIELLRKSNLLVSKTLAEVAKLMKPGITTLEINNVADKFIRDHGGVPGFLNYNGFPKSICVSVNNYVVHGIPSSYVLQEGDIVSVDCGVYMNGFHGDSAYTFAVGEINIEKKKLLQITKECLYLGIEQAVEGNRIGDIGWVIQQYAQKNGFSVVRELVGHGVGKNLHEKPEVPNYGKRGAGMKIQRGLVIAIEPMINLGKKEVRTESDKWTVATIDKKPSAHFEHSIAVTSGEADILSTFDYIEEELNKNK